MKKQANSVWVHSSWAVKIQHQKTVTIISLAIYGPHSFETGKVLYLGAMEIKEAMEMIFERA